MKAAISGITLLATLLAVSNPIRGEVRKSCDPQQPGEDFTHDCVFFTGNDTGCDAIVATCPAGSPGELIELVAESEPNDSIFDTSPDFGAQRINSLPFFVNGIVSVGDPGELILFFDLFEDFFVFEISSTTTLTARLFFDQLDANGNPTDLDFDLIGVNPLRLIASGATGSNNPETIRSVTLTPDTYFFDVTAFDSTGNERVFYFLEVLTEVADAGCDGIPATGDMGEGNSKLDIPPDEGENNDILDVPPDSSCVQVNANCDIQPSSLNLNSRGTFLSIKTSLTDSLSGVGLDPVLMAPAHISRINSASVGDITLPIPRTEPGCDDLSEDGIWESIENRTVDEFGLAILRFIIPSDGQCETMDGTRQDIIALMLDIPDGESAQICYTSIYPNAPDPVDCCASVLVKNHGKR